MARFTTGRVFVFGALPFLLVAGPTMAQQEAWWTWQDRNGKTHQRAELDIILREHHHWVESDGKVGRRADLSRADLSFADLVGADLREADLRHATLNYAKLTVGADLGAADLREAELNDADLSGAVLVEGKVKYERGKFVVGSFHPVGANLSGAHLRDAKLRGANLIYVDLSSADLDRADLTDAAVGSANLSGAIFEPISLPPLRGIAQATNLELLTYRDSPDALVQLRKQLVDGGFREQERKITCALKRREAELSWDACRSRKIRAVLPKEEKTRAILWSSDSNAANCGSFVLNRVFFDWTCQYGMSPGRPPSLGVLLWLLCSVLYFACIRTSGEAGLYRVYAQSIQENPSGQRRVERVSPPALAQTRGVRRLFQFLRREWAVFRTSMFFSLMSAFNIGFRDINFGRWLRLLTRQEFDIKAVGWARVVAGWQSLISVFLIALWVLTYFGRPFG